MTLREINSYLKESGLHLYRGKEYFYFMTKNGLDIPESIYTNLVETITITDLDHAIKEFEQKKFDRT